MTAFIIVWLIIGATFPVANLLYVIEDEGLPEAVGAFFDTTIGWFLKCIAVYCAATLSGPLVYWYVYRQCDLDA